MSENTYLALVLKRRDRGESDRLLTVLTREKGRLDVIAKGARKSGSRLAAASEPLSFIRIQVAEGKQMAYVTQFEPSTSFRGLRVNYNRLVLALAIAELVDTCSHHDLVNDELFDLALVILKYVEVHPDPLVAAIWGQLQLLSAEGVAPQWASCVLTERPIHESPCWVSPGAGGAIDSSVAPDIADRFQVPAEVLIGLDRMSQLPEPPPRLKRADEALSVLYAFWRHAAHRSLPAFESALKVLRSGD